MSRQKVRREDIADGIAGDVFGTDTAADEHMVVFDGDGYHLKDGGEIPVGIEPENKDNLSSVVASGGTETTVDGYKYHTFITSGDFTVTNPGYVELLIVAGGGGGGRAEANAGGDGAGGGGGGGSIIKESHYVFSGVKPVEVGNGGAGATTYGPAGSNGQNSSFDALIAYGGGGGGSDAAPNGVNGGCGGGACNSYGDTARAGLPVKGQGYAGGDASASNTTWRGGSGGGGGGGQGINRSSAIGGVGGSGIITPFSVVGICGGGGGGGCATTGGIAGYGGGGNGGNSAGAGSAGTANTGGGGGGGGSIGGNGGTGGSGIVIIRYKI